MIHPLQFQLCWEKSDDVEVVANFTSHKISSPFFLDHDSVDYCHTWIAIVYKITSREWKPFEFGVNLKHIPELADQVDVLQEGQVFLDICLFWSVLSEKTPQQDFWGTVKLS